MDMGPRTRVVVCCYWGNGILAKERQNYEVIIPSAYIKTCMYLMSMERTHVSQHGVRLFGTAYGIGTRASCFVFFFARNGNGQA